MSPEKALAFLSDLIKQIITLSSGIVALSVALLKGVAVAKLEPWLIVIILVGWLAFLASVLAGVDAARELTSALITSGQQVPSIDKVARRVRGQTALFVAGLIFSSAGAAGVLVTTAGGNHHRPPERKNPPMIRPAAARAPGPA